MAADDAIDERGTGARQPDDEDRCRIGRADRGAARGSRECLCDPSGRRHVVLYVVAYMGAADLRTALQPLERAAVIAEIFVLLGEGVMDLHGAPPVGNARCRESFELADVIALEGLRA